MFLIFADLGLTMLAVREVSRDRSRADSYMSNIIFIKLCLSLATWFMVFILINILGYPPDTKRVVYILMLALIINSFVEAFGAVFRAYEEMGYVSMLMMVQKFVGAAGGRAALTAGFKLESVAYAYLAGSLLSGAAGYAIMSRKFVKPGFKLEPEFCVKIIKSALPVGVSIFFSGIYFRVDIVLLSLLKGDAMVGWYSAAYKPMEALMVIPAGFTGALFPVFSNLYRTAGESLPFTCEKAIKILFIFILPVAAGTTMLAGKLITLFYGSGFSNAVIALKILIWASVLIFVNFVLTQLLIAIDRQKYNAVFAVVCAVFNLSLNLLFIPSAGYVAASIITVLTEALLFIMCFAVISKHLGVIPLHRVIYKPLITCGLMCIALYYVRGLALFLSVPAAALVYLLCLKLVKALDEKDYGILKSLFKGGTATVL
jgi:O-antigen/teichoic acid export membrane protein